ncbi:MAG: hypothetical protein H0V66_10150 [Bdellovibrionales bacterium]|nr:hypothetical protein [Bdellovibrionales bacterium]
MKKLISILLLLITSTALACENVNFYEDHPLINQLPIQNQGALNTCYAQTLSNVYNLEFARDNDDVVDPYWIAFNHKVHGFHWQPRKLDYSLMSLAWNDLRKNGYCDVAYLKPVYEGLKKGTNYSNDQLFYLLTEFFKTKNLLTAKTYLGFYMTINRLMTKLAKESNHAFEIPWKREDLISILFPLRQEAHRLSLFTWMESKVFKSCRESAVFKPTETLISIGRNKEHNDTLAIVTEALLAQKRSISLGFCAKILKDPKVDISITPRLLKALKPNCGAHYVTLVGSRKKANSCQYLVRNSYGKTFWAHQDYTCYCKDKASGKNRDCAKSESSNPNLEVLGCWVDKEKLLTNSYDISYFRK